MQTHVRNELLRDLSKSLFSKLGWARNVLAERNKLHDITLSDISLAVLKSDLITVKSIHVLELGAVTNTDDNDTERQSVGGLDDLLHGGTHIVDATIGDDEEDEVLLLIGVLGVHPDDFSGLVDDLGKVGRTRKTDVLDGHVVCIQNALHARHLWVRGITVEGEAVAH